MNQYPYITYEKDFGAEQYQSYFYIMRTIIIDFVICDDNKLDFLYKTTNDII